MFGTSVRLLALCVGVATLTPSSASTRVGIYAIIDDVVFEPSDLEPERVLISGTFVLPVPITSGEHARPASGMLYFSLNPAAPGPTRTDWRALRKAAGTGEVVGFGEYWMSCANTRALESALRNPASHCSFEATVQSDRTKLVPEAYPAPSA